ncbi:hypothetical protein K493DRAFT_207892 [Basidiobolus meristosporus CBS 931.73]|uniref:Uncharacterized protein n=1 Tax=Basidiobolus meristosporus CBS 931.73 TaxID=1314790 RepID=A0A1Y1YXI0_9FUNG|nr:hypothetical protein K493DRAFT_207892 [Basidiobolus meristosporus CBS 931.73]|eukprot:ORY02720.1 hypothetical protein K493DRAFT_207892 [Basidiobolus meristosporus CBS 931.73]
MASIFQRISSKYTKRLHTHPLSTLALTNGALAIVSDILAQSISKPPNPAPPEEDNFVNTESVREEQKYNFARTARLSFYGFATAPLINKWYTVLDKGFPLPKASSSGMRSNVVKAVVKRVAADQILFAPFGLVLFFTGISIMEGASWEGIKDKFEKAYLPGLIANYQLWPLAQMVNFFYVPLKLRVPFASTVGVFWTAYLSWLNSRNPISPERTNRHRIEVKDPLLAKI